MKEILEMNKYYASKFTEFEKNLNGDSETFWHSGRKEGAAELEKLAFPTLKDEEWKYTNVAPILKHSFRPAGTIPAEIHKETINKAILNEIESDLMVFVNGNFNSEYSRISDLPEGVVITSLRSAVKEYPELVKRHLGNYVVSDNAFRAMNKAFALDGFFIFLPKGKTVERTLQIVSIASGENIAINSHNLIVAEENSEIKIINTFRSEGVGTNLTNLVNEFALAENSRVHYYKIQNENEESFHIDRTQAHQKDNSEFTHLSFSTGGKIARSDINSELDGENIQTHFYGLYLANNSQHVDNHTFADHAKPNCESNELYKGILDDNSRGVFNGKIMVRPDAQKTNAYQSNKTILLSDSARIDTKPQLEIFADDVKCSHGATVGQLDETAYFYIRSRGVPAELAKSMLIRAFANDVVEKVKIPELRKNLNHRIFEHLHKVEI